MFKTFKLTSGEYILPNEYPIHVGFVYIVDNIFTRCEVDVNTVAECKARFGVKEIRQCDLFDHDDARLGDRVE